MKTEAFNFKKNTLINKKYIILKFVGSGTEGEVYLIEEKKTKVKRAAKFFYPHKNKNNKALQFYAKKLDKLGKCEMVISYHTEDSFEYKGKTINFLISEYINGMMLSKYISTLSHQQMQPYQALHFLYTLTKGVEQIHQMNEYHGDIHTENIMIEQFGINISIKIIDMYNWNKDSKAQNKKDDLYNIIHVFYEILGGKQTYKRQPSFVKKICMGVHQNKIITKFKSVNGLRKYIEQLNLLKPDTKK